jgi:hypothetical protein
MTSYPEKIPNSITPIKNFSFTLENSYDIKNELETQLHNLNERIDKIIDHFTLDDVPIIKFILNVNEDRDQLKKLAKALDRIADLIEAKNSVIPKLQVIKMAQKDPDWFAWTFGDFSQDIESDLDRLSLNNIDGDFDV